ncbi:hypothetical protein pb186bvf_019548 [Paramecium bursaria]
MIVLKDNQISIKDPTNKQAEYQNFKFDNVFDKNATQQKLYDQVFDYDYMNQNSCILSYGQSGSGKSFSIFGTLQSPGLLPLLVMKLFKMNCKLSASFQEVYIDQVKDLHTDLITEEFTKKEINNIGELWEIIKVVQKTDIKRQVRTHILFTLEVNNQYRVQFVDLAGSERVAKNLTEGSKYQEAIMINSSHTILGRCLTILNQNSQKLLPTNESKLTKYLMLQPTTYISLIGNINPSESNYEECLATLQFMDRTKNIQLNIKKSASMADDKTFQIQMEKQIKRLMDENEALKQKIDQMALERKKKFSDLQKILGLDIDLEKLSNKTAKDITQFRIQQEALVKSQQLESQMDEKIQEIIELKRQIKTLEQESHQKIERLTSTLFEQKELQKKLKEQLSAQKINSDDTVRQLTAEKEQVVKRMIENSNNLLEEKISSILSLPQFAQTKSVENQKLQEVRKASKLEAEKDFKIALEQIRQEQQRLLNACKTQYEYFLNEKNNEIEKFLAQFKDYRLKKKQQYINNKGHRSKNYRKNCLDLFDICTKQAKVIEKIENGGYSAGIKSFSIPKQDKPNLPIRSKHKNLFKCIDNRSTSLTLTKKNTINEKTIRNTPKNIRQSQTQKDYITDILDTAQLDQLNFHMMDLSTLRNYAIKLRDMIKEQQDQFTQVQDKLKNQIASAIKERDEIQTKYNVESRKYNSTRVVIESQNRLLSKVRPLSSVQRKS